MGDFLCFPGQEKIQFLVLKVTKGATKLLNTLCFHEFVSIFFFTFSRLFQRIFRHSCRKISRKSKKKSNKILKMSKNSRQAE